MQPYKLCPQCGQTAALDAPQCPHCRRGYQTTAPGQMQTQVIVGPLHGASPLRYPIGVSAAAVLILAAAWMPWQATNASSSFPTLVTGWNGLINLSGLLLPDWIVVLAAAGVVLISWLYTLSIWRSPRSLPLGLIVYGCVHAAFAILAVQQQSGTPGSGIFFTGLTFVGMFFLIRQQYRTT